MEMSKVFQDIDFLEVFADTDPDLSPEDLGFLFVWIVNDPIVNEIRISVLESLAAKESQSDGCSQELAQFEQKGPIEFVNSQSPEDLKRLLGSSKFLRSAQQLVNDRIHGRGGVSLNDLSTWQRTVDVSGPSIAAKPGDSQDQQFVIQQSHINAMRKLANWFVNDLNVAEELVAQALADIDLEKIDLTQNPQAYLNGAVNFKFRAYLRKKMRGPKVEPLSDPEGNNIDVQDTYEPEFLVSVNKLCTSALESLGPTEKEVVRLYYHCRFSDPKIAEVLGMSQSTVWRTRKGALTEMKEFLENRGVTECPTR